MRQTMIALGGIAVASWASVAEAQAPDYTESNAQYIESALRAEAASHGIQLPDFSMLTASAVEYDLATAQLVEKQVPLTVMLRQVAAQTATVDLSTMNPAATGPVPTLGVGNNAHAYGSVRIGQCSPKGYYTGWVTAQQVPGSYTPNPLFPIVPVLGFNVYGGPGFHVKGGGWQLGAHVFLGAPVDANVNTSEFEGLPVSPLIGLGFDQSIDAAGVGQIVMSSTAVRIAGFCVGSIDLGYIFENGYLAVDGEVIPDNPAGL